MAARKPKTAIYRPNLTRRIISKREADRKGWNLYSVPEYALKFHLSQDGVYYQIRARKIHAYKHAGKWVIVSRD